MLALFFFNIFKIGTYLRWEHFINKCQLIYSLYRHENEILFMRFSFICEIQSERGARQL